MRIPPRNRNRGRLCVWMVAALLFLCGCQRNQGTPSIILILVDTLRADYIGAYGFDGPISPNLDAFAAESVVFENCFSQAPWTKPSVASLFTSLQPDVHQVLTHKGLFAERGTRTETGTLAEEAVTLAEALGDKGFATAAFVANPWIRPQHGFGQGFDVFDTTRSGNSTRADYSFGAARDWIGRVPAERPYFVYLHLMDVHGPYNAPEEDYDAVRDSPELGDQPIPLTQKEVRRIPKYLRRTPWARKGPEDARIWRARYAANIHAFDRRLGPFLVELRRAGVLDAAIIVVTSDHGEQLHEHGGWDHGSSLYDEELHVPLIVRLPGGLRGGERVAEVVSLIDVMPTLVEAAGAAAVAGVQGRQLNDLLEGESDTEAPPTSFATAVKWEPALHSARSERFKLIKDRDSGRAELYDLEKDPGEQQDVAAHSSALPHMEMLLREQLDRDAARGELRGEPSDLPEQVRERLRALGYDEPPPATETPSRRIETPSLGQLGTD